MPWRRRTPPGPVPSPGAASPGAAASSRQQAVSPALLAWAQELDATRLSPGTITVCERFLRDYRKQMLPARRETAFRLRSAIEAESGLAAPVSVPSMDVIATAVQLRRRQLGFGPL